MRVVRSSMGSGICRISALWRRKNALNGIGSFSHLEEGIHSSCGRCRGVPMTTGDRFRTLSKSDFKAARSCQAKLYYRELGYPNAMEDDDYLRMLAEGGYMVETLAKLHYPDGVALEY